MQNMINANELRHKDQLAQKPVPCSDTDESLQAAVSIVAMLYGEGLILHKIEPHSTGDFEFAVNIIYRLLKAQGATFANYPSISYSTPKEQG